MKTKDPVELAIANALKSARMAIRLKHTLNADAEINATLPELEAAMYAQAVEGKPFSVDIAKLFS